ncbi:hypothetical protein CPC08DRAFT_423384 [Agrocybe pediades]|nr:hypothetical protein CPC08DRAFT_423384 [Agrocybe pediades]
MNINRYYSATSTMISSDQALVTGCQFSQDNYHGQALNSLDSKAPLDILTEVVYDSGAALRSSERPSTKMLKDSGEDHTIDCSQDEEAHANHLYGSLGRRDAGNPSLHFLRARFNSGSNNARYLLAFSSAEKILAETTAQDPHCDNGISTIPHQPYCEFPETAVQAEILSRIRKDPLIFKIMIERQSTSLIIQPLRTYLANNHLTQHRTPFLLVTVGLDDYDDRASPIAISIGLPDSFIRCLLLLDPSMTSSCLLAQKT